MSILIVGASHRSASVDTLELLALDHDGAVKLRAASRELPYVSEALVLATCNRTEIYAEVDRFHGSVEELTALLLARAGVTVGDVMPSLYVHYDEAAVAHLFSVVTGLDSMVVGEGQILGQVREALRDAQTDETVGASLNTLFQQGLRVGKRAHSETGIDHAGQSMVSVALDEATEVLGTLAGARVSIIGAGSIAALAAASVADAGAGEIVVMSRTEANATRLALHVGGRTARLSTLESELDASDLVICCTGSTGAVVTTEVVAAAALARAGRPLVLVDLALPRDVEEGAQRLPGVVVVGLRDLAASVHNGAAGEDVAAVKAIVVEEVAAYSAALSAARVAPTVVALRSLATAVVAGELDRLWGRLDGVSAQQQDEISRTVRRVADKLLHEPTVRIKELADRTADSSYADALAELFALDPSSVDAVTRAGDAQ